MSRNSRNLKVVPEVKAKPIPATSRIIKQAQMMVERGRDASQGLIDKMTKDPLDTVNDTLYRLSLAEDAALTMHEAEFAQWVLYGVEHFLGKDYGRMNLDVLDEAMEQELVRNALTESLKNIRASITRSLLNNEWRGSSSGGFHNAVEHAKREAASRFLRQLDSFDYSLSHEKD